MAAEADDDDLFASLGIHSFPDSPKRKPARQGAGTGAGAGAGSSQAGSGAGGWGFADGGMVDGPGVGLFEPAPLFWHELKSNLKPAEVDVVASVIGSDLIDRNEALFTEAHAFADILRDLHSENEALKADLANRPRLRATQSHKMLGQQIKLLLTSLNQEAGPATPKSARPMTPRDLVATPREAAVVEFATGGDGPAAQLARTRGGSLSRATSFRSIGTPRRPSSSNTCQSAPDRLKPVMNKITAFNVDKLRGEFRSVMEDEHDRLMADIEFLQELLEDESSVRKETQERAKAPAMPSVSDLRSYSEKLETLVAEKERHERTEALLCSTNGAAHGGSGAPSSPVRTPKLAPLRAHMVPSPPPGVKRDKDAPVRSRPTRVASRTGSGRRGKPPVAPGSPTVGGKPKAKGKPPRELARLGRGTVGGDADAAGLLPPPRPLAGLKHPRVSRAARLREQVSENRHLT